MKIMQGPWFLIFFVLGLPVLVPTEAEVYVAVLSTAWQCVLVLFYLVFDTAIWYQSAFLYGGLSRLLVSLYHLDMNFSLVKYDCKDCTL